MKPFHLKIVLAALVVVNVGIWCYHVFGPRHDMEKICSAFSGFSQDRKSGMELEPANVRLLENLESMWTERGRNFGAILTDLEPVFRRKEIENEGRRVGMRMWSCPGVSFD
jgi:hypothetical protein